MSVLLPTTDEPAATSGHDALALVERSTPTRQKAPSEETDKRRRLRVALAGNPNSGKTSIFNALTGSRQRVGNYPGVTVERRDGYFSIDGGQIFDVLDLPGTYSLSSYSPDERVAEQELIQREADVVVVVVDSNTLERSLILLVQLEELGIQPVLCLNMADEAKKNGQTLDLDLLQKRLKCPVVETIAHKAIGIEELRAAIVRVAKEPADRAPPHLGEALDQALSHIVEALRDCQGLKPHTLPWIASGLLVGDEALREWVLAEGDPGRRAFLLANRERQNLEVSSNLDAPLLMIQGRQRVVRQLLDGAVRTAPRPDARKLSDAIDRVLVNRVLGLPIFLAVMYALFWVTFKLGEIPMGWIETGTEVLAHAVSSLWPTGSDSLLRSMLVDGVISGVGGVIIFLPNIVLLFWGLSILENSGYMARAAFLMDRLLHRFGLHGRSFLPLMTGFGCTIPGIMATRTLENEKDRLTTMLVLPLMSCGARLAVWLLLVPTFFPPSWRAPVLWGIYLVGIFFALGIALLLRRSVFRGDDSPFVMELPPYRLPSWRSVLSEIGARSGLYLKKAGTVILAFSIILWVLSNYPRPSTYRVDAQIAAGELRVVSEESPLLGRQKERAEKTTSATQGNTQDSAQRAPVELITPRQAQSRRDSEALRHSLLGRIGQGVAVIMAPLGFDWRVSTAIVGTFAAKEVFIAQMAIIYALDGETDGGTAHLREAIANNMTPLAGVSLILFLLIATPCMATVAVMRRETGGWRWPIIQFAALTVLGYTIALLVYQVGRLFLT